GVTVNDGAGNVTDLGAGTISVAGAGNTIAIDGSTGTIGGLTNTTFDPNNFTTGQAASEDQLKQVSDVANSGWNVTDGTNTANIGPNGDVTFTGDSNIAVAQSGV
ncbi:hypothetical protein, partial [Halomonas alkaliantarctica]|uniref:hypothetical protein n=1 Tax=Halomonas alkaliantarctica TaxID=232346 RepID=UPI002658697A